MEIYDELTREAQDARERSARLGALSLDLRDRDEHAMAKVARSWATRQEALADELEALRDFIERTVEEEVHA